MAKHASHAVLQSAQPFVSEGWYNLSSLAGKGLRSPLSKCRNCDLLVIGSPVGGLGLILQLQTFVTKKQITGRGSHHRVLPRGLRGGCGHYESLAAQPSEDDRTGNFSASSHETIGFSLTGRLAII